MAIFLQRLRPRHHLPAALVFLLLTALFAWLMYLRTGQEQNWGYLSLGLLLSLWFLIVALRTRRWGADPGRWRWLGLTTLAGLLLFLGFPPSPLTPLMFVALLPLLVVQREVEEHNAKGEKKHRLFFYLFHAFLLWNILSTFWLANASLPAALFANTANALLMCLPFLLWHQARRVMRGSITRAALVSFWLTFEYLHHRWDLAWPWLSLGNAWGEWPALVQWYEYTGVLGGSLWILLTNIFLFRLVRHYYFGEKIRKRGVTIALLLWLLLPAAWSLIRYAGYEEQGVSQEIVVVQPDSEPHYEKPRLEDADMLQHLLELSEEKLTDSTDYLVFPEAALKASRIDELGRVGATARLQEFVDGRPGLRLVTGLTLIEWFPEGEELPDFAREYTDRLGRLRHWAVYNAAIQLASGQEDIPVYYKSKLVPGAESFPFRRYLAFLDPLLEPLGAGGSGFGYQAEREAFTSAGQGVGPLICYESAFGAYVTGYVRQGADALFVITNDSWWDNTLGHRQHLRLASLRAIETRRPIARAANGGISCLVDQRGRILQPTHYGQATAIRGQLAFNDRYTFYTRWGDLLGRIAFFLSMLLALNVVAKSLGPAEKRQL